MCQVLSLVWPGLEQPTTFYWMPIYNGCLSTTDADLQWMPIYNGCLLYKLLHACVPTMYDVTTLIAWPQVWTRVTILFQATSLLVLFYSVKVFA